MATSPTRCSRARRDPRGRRAAGPPSTPRASCARRAPRPTAPATPARATRGARCWCRTAASSRSPASSPAPPARPPRAPGRYARVGDDPLNHWVHERTPEADFDFSHQPRAGEPVTLTSTSRHPEGAGYFTTFRWDLDNDGAFDDATGRSVSAVFPTVGKGVAGLEASKPGGDKASIYYASTSEPLPARASRPPGGAHRRPAGQDRPARHDPRRQAPEGEARPLRDPHPLRQDGAEGHRRDRGLPRRRRIGIARTKVKRGATKRVRVKLTRIGRRALSRSSTHRLKVRVRVRVGRTILRTKRLTIRR